MRASHSGLWRALVALLLIIPIVAGCGPRQASGTVKIGLVAPFEGSHRSIGYDAIYAARLAVREINAAGGIDGWRIELVAYDDRGEVNLAQRTAENLAIDRDVVAVIGHYRSDTSSAATSIYADEGLPALVLGDWEGNTPAAWSLAPSPNALAEAMTAVAEQQGVTSAVVSGQGAVSVALLARGILEATPSPSPVGADLVYALWPSIQSAEQLVEWREHGWEGQVVGGLDLAAPAFGQIAGENADNVLSVTSYPYPEDIGGIEEWIADYQSMGPHVSPPGPYALPTYEAVRLIAAAIAAARDADRVPTRETVGEALSGIRRNGWLGEISWDNEGYWQSPALYVYRWIDGDCVLVEQVR